MRLAFNYPCRVGVTTADGDMSSMVFGTGEVVDNVIGNTITLVPVDFCDFSLTDGTLLKHVPVRAVRMEPDFDPVPT